MFNYDAEKGIISITVDPLEFDIDDLVGTIQMALDDALEKRQDGCVDDMDDADYRELCNLIFEKAKYYV